MTSKKLVWCLSIMISFLSCSEEEEQPRFQRVQKELQPYVRQFLDAAQAHGTLDLTETSYEIRFGKIDGIMAAVANRDHQTIIIDERYKIYPRTLEYIVMHECGHYFLRLRHGEGLIMNETIDMEIVNKYFENKEMYTNEMFAIANDSQGFSGK